MIKLKEIAVCKKCSTFKYEGQENEKCKYCKTDKHIKKIDNNYMTIK